MKCKTCGRDLTDSYFPVRGRKVDGSPSYRSSCRTCWNSIRRERESPKHRCTNEITDNLLKSLVELSGNSTDMLSAITKEEFVSYTGCTDVFSFTNLKERAYEYLDSIGVGNPATIQLPEKSKVLIVGDTYGQHTRTGMFSLIKNICKEYKVTHIVAVGRQLDENDTISHCFRDMPCPVIFVATADEISKLHKLNDGIGGLICREYVQVGSVRIRNQEQISPYVKKPIYSLDPLIFDTDTIVNCTRQEYGTHNSTITTSYIASPGTLAEPFVPKVRNKLLIKGGLKVAQVFSSSFKKYRKAEEDKTLWQQGCILLSYDMYTPTPIFLPIKKIDGEYTTAFDGTVITETEVKEVPVSVVVSDIHAPKHDVFSFCAFLSYLKARDVQDVILNGDIVDMEAVNHHVLSKGLTPETSMAENIIALESVLRSIHSVVPRTTCIEYITGNHSDFLDRWTAKNTQFTTLFDSIISSIFDKYNILRYGVHDYSELNNTYVLHGNTYVSASGSTNTERVARAFGSSILGHSHSTNLRFGCLRTGCLCSFDQGYNSPYGNWDRSFAVHTSYKNTDFVSPMFIKCGVISEGRTLINYDKSLEIQLTSATVTITE